MASGARGQGGSVFSRLLLGALLALAGLVAVPSLASATTSHTFTNGATQGTYSPITIPTQGTASPYPSTINVSSVQGKILASAQNINVFLNGFQHTEPEDVGIVLEGPTGARAMLMSTHIDTSAGADSNVLSSSFAFNAGASGAVPAQNNVGNTSYWPTARNQDDFDTIGTAYSSPAATGTASHLHDVFDGTNPNGDWKLYIQDFAAGNSGGFTGWGISFATIAECEDGIDNDGDGHTDFSADPNVFNDDPGCSSLTSDNSELNPNVACDDGIDNDNDGFEDFASPAHSLVDPGCSGLTDTDEDSAALQCDNGQNDDLDQLVDYQVSGGDPGCASPNDSSELNVDIECDDNADNDSDTGTDFPFDPGCANASDDDERKSEGGLPPLPCDDAADNDGDGK